jgi:hypothetical protein
MGLAEDFPRCPLGEAVNPIGHRRTGNPGQKKTVDQASDRAEGRLVGGAKVERRPVAFPALHP